MNRREIRPGIEWVGAVDWQRQLFDELIPLPRGTSYNAYLVRGREKTALLDAVDPAFRAVLFQRLEGVERIDYLVAHHAEQDHSGAIPDVLARFPEAKVLATPKGVQFLQELLAVPADRLQAVQDGETLALGGRTLRFLHMPWVHWPETMVSFLEEDKVLFPCDLFGSHLATSDLWARDEAAVLDAARMYYAQILMHAPVVIRKYIERIQALGPALIAPSHGPVYDRPALILEAYRRWAGGVVANKVVLPYVSMHGSTALLVQRLIESLTARGVSVQPFELAHLRLDQFAAALVDAATIVFAAPAVLGGAHPLAAFVAALVDAYKPPVKYAGYLGSYGWSRGQIGKTAEMLPHLKVEVLDPVLCAGLPRVADLEAVDRLAAQIAEKHAGLAPAGG
ncbi:MAG: FprA family A-type flavoprotein [Kiritimatiellaeota bacterium]|nr:FprA family A-type flavoprotein [Kiritimatiellota bacterium]